MTPYLVPVNFSALSLELVDLGKNWPTSAALSPLEEHEEQKENEGRQWVLQLSPWLPLAFLSCICWRGRRKGEKSLLLLPPLYLHFTISTRLFCSHHPQLLFLSSTSVKRESRGQRGKRRRWDRGKRGKDLMYSKHL